MEKGNKMKQQLCVLVVSGLIMALEAAAPQSYDVVVYGGTSAGVTAAIQARRMGKSAVIVAPKGKLGGVTSSGLGATDMPSPFVVGGSRVSSMSAFTPTTRIRSSGAISAAMRTSNPLKARSMGANTTA
jgi:hypothetical protein